MPKLTDETLKQIIQRRDAKYDGRFFFGVKTTKIYCRPVCPAKPHPENILIFKSAAEAERAGFRPCLRCHPDAAPNARLWEGTFNTVSRALRIIEDEVFAEPTIQNLADRLGISERHLRRLFEAHLGASPVEILISKRLHLAYTLVMTTAQPLSEIALAAGFQSIRRFNEAFKTLYHHPPSHFRKKIADQAAKNKWSLQLPISEPYDWNLVIGYLKRHEAFGIERVSENKYVRFLPYAKTYGRIEVTYPKAGILMLSLHDIPLRELRGILRRIKNLFDLDHHPAHLPKDDSVKTLGVRVPGSFDSFESAVSIILSQLVSTDQARAKLKQLIVAFGTVLPADSGEPVYAFPKPSVLKNAELEALGMTRVKAAAIREISRLVDENKLDLSPSSDLEKTREALQEIKGVGPWTVESIAMRCLRDPDSFPKNDLIIQRALTLLKLDDSKWASFRAYLTHCLWRDHGGKKKT